MIQELKVVLKFFKIAHVEVDVADQNIFLVTIQKCLQAVTESCIKHI
jgi:hypothetical protein